MFCLFQDPRLGSELEYRGTGTLESRTVTVCSGLDLVNIMYNNFVAPDEKTAKVIMVIVMMMMMMMIMKMTTVTKAMTALMTTDNNDDDYEHWYCHFKKSCLEEKCL